MRKWDDGVTVNGGDFFVAETKRFLLCAIICFVFLGQVRICRTWEICNGYGGIEKRATAITNITYYSWNDFSTSLVILAIVIFQISNHLPIMQLQSLPVSSWPSAAMECSVKTFPPYISDQPYPSWIVEKEKSSRLWKLSNTLYSRGRFPSQLLLIIRIRIVEMRR